MRSLEEWDNYLDQQEKALKKTLNKESSLKTDAISGEQSNNKSHENRSAAFHTDADDLSLKSPEKITTSGKSIVNDDNLPDIQKVVKLRKNLPKQVLIPETPESEIAQNSYKGFRETREELLDRLLDPQISLEDAARILNVCPTTVRRYTNKGLLKHYRTPGNQRRFRLSDVLAFLEIQAEALDEIE